MRNFSTEISILGRLFNDTLINTPFFFPRPIKEWQAIFREFAPLLENKNIIFALKNGIEIGFMLWHPNYNMILHNNATNNAVSFYLKYLFHRSEINQFKINAVGVMPQYYKSGVILGLFQELYVMVGDKYSAGETSFVFDENIASTKICQRFCGNPYRQYKIYETSSQKI